MVWAPGRRQAGLLVPAAVPLSGLRRISGPAPVRFWAGWAEPVSVPRRLITEYSAQASAHQLEDREKLDAFEVQDGCPGDWPEFGFRRSELRSVDNEYHQHGKAERSED